METKKEKNELKIIVVGNSGTGKTSFVRKWIKNTFDENYKATIVSEFQYKIIEYKRKYYKIQLWDLAGQDINSCITKIFARNSHGCIVFTDITDEKSLNESIKWKNSVDDISKFIVLMKLNIIYLMIELMIFVIEEFIFILLKLLPN